MRLVGSLIAMLGLLFGTAWGAESVQIVVPEKLAPPAAHGLQKLTAALNKHGCQVQVTDTLTSASQDTIVLGLASQKLVAELLAKRDITLSELPESLAVVRFRGEKRQIVCLAGRDPVGLMYAALDTAQRISWADPQEHPFTHIQETVEEPFLWDRAISTYTMQRRFFEQRLYDEQYWKKLFDMLAESRINSYVIIFGYENGGFLAPAYPFFFDVEEFPDVKMYGITPEQQAKNTAALHRVIALAHERGIRITLGIWDHIYRGGVQSGGIILPEGQKLPHLVYGLSAKNLVAYNKAALRKFLATFPEVDAIQFRMHWESGLTRKETPDFWHEVFSVLRQERPDLLYDLRAKGLPDVVIEDALAQGLRFRIATKYWMEQMGMPFHPTHINRQNQHDRRHGYADLLRWPKRYDMHWRMWSGGTARVLLWGDPQYVRRFAESARLYDGRSFEVNEMLATKMLGAPHDAEPTPILNPRYQHYTYEFERYWHYYQVWGRVTYNPNCSPEIWQREFVRRFGKPAGLHVMKALHVASNILPRIVGASYNYRYFPTTRGWAEMMRFGNLSEYANGTGTDIEQFQSYADAAEDLLAGRFTTKCTPFQTARWFTQTAEEILERVKQAEQTVGNLPEKQRREFVVTLTDLRILTHLAQYHAARMRAAVWFNVYRKTKDQFALDRAIEFETQAVDAWRQIVASAGDVYFEKLQFGVHRVGFSYHWKEELEKLEEGLAELKQLTGRQFFDAATKRRLLEHEKRMSAEPEIEITVDRAAQAVPGQDLVVTATVKAVSGVKEVLLRYRHVTQFEDYETVRMQLDPSLGKFVGKIPGDFIIPQWDVMYFVEALPSDGPGRTAPYFEKEMPYVVVPVKR